MFDNLNTVCFRNSQRYILVLLMYTSLSEPKANSEERKSITNYLFFWGGGRVFTSYGRTQGSKPLNRAFGPVQSFE